MNKTHPTLSGLSINMICHNIDDYGCVLTARVLQMSSPEFMKGTENINQSKESSPQTVQQLPSFGRAWMTFPEHKMMNPCLLTKHLFLNPPAYPMGPRLHLFKSFLYTMHNQYIVYCLRQNGLIHFLCLESILPATQAQCWFIL